jgi:cytochrome P450
MRHWFSDVAAFRRDPLTLMLQRGSRATTPLARLRLGFRPVFLVTDPELIKPILKMDEAMVDKGRLTHKLRAVVGISSLTLSGEEHDKRRNALHPHMARGQVEKLAPAMAAEIRRVATDLARRDEFDVHAMSAALALKLISIAMFGHQILSPADEETMVQAVHSVEDELAADMFRVLPASPWAAQARRRRQDFARAAMGLVVQRARWRAPENSVFASLQRLGLTDAELRDEIMTMLIAGHHTTGTASAWVVYYLATQPGLARSVAREAEKITSRGGELVPERFKEAPVSQALVREVLRLFPSAWWFSREVRQRVEIGGKRVEPGTSLLICPWQMHRDPRFWDSPEQFRIDRNHNSKAFIPFGAGPRTCIGMGVAMLQLQLLAMELAAAFTFEMTSDQPVSQPKPSITLIPPRMIMRIRGRGILQEEPAAA